MKFPKLTKWKRTGKNPLLSMAWGLNCWLSWSRGQKKKKKKKQHKSKSKRADTRRPPKAFVLPVAFSTMKSPHSHPAMVFTPIISRSFLWSEAFPFYLSKSSAHWRFHIPIPSFSCSFQHLVLCYMGFLPGSVLKNLPEMQGNGVQSLGWEDLLEEGLATHSSALAWRITWR